MRVAIQGVADSFHDLATRHWYDQPVDLVCCATFAEVFKALQDGKADQAVIAIENSLYGSIIEVYDLLAQYDFLIIGELSERIHQNVIGLEGAKLSDISTILSHPVALAQASEYLDRQLGYAERQEYHDTAAAVDYIIEQANPRLAALASHAAAQKPGAMLLAERVENDPKNYTRFAVVAPAAAPVDNPNKATLLLRTAHEAGALYQALSIFASRDINMTKLQSRPIVGEIWQYQFYIDVEASGQELNDAIAELTENGCIVELLGEYRADTTQYED